MPNLQKLARILGVCTALLALNGCAAPPALQLLSLAVDGISYIATDKTVADHGLSLVAQKDCKMLRTFGDEEICLDANAEVEENEAPETILLSEEQSAQTEP